MPKPVMLSVAPEATSIVKIGADASKRIRLMPASFRTTVVKLMAPFAKMAVSRGTFCAVPASEGSSYQLLTPFSMPSFQSSLRRPIQ